MITSNVTKEAVIAGEGRFRYRLDRHWDKTKGYINFIMLNPSTADAYQDDPTITRCIARAKEYGYGGLVVTNLFAYRSTDPTKLRWAKDRIGELNDIYILDAAKGAAAVVMAWGDHGKLDGRGPDVFGKLFDAGIEPKVLRYTLKGQPEHPLYVPYALKPEVFDRAPRKEKR